MRQRGGDVRELMHDGCPTACVGDAAFGCEVDSAALTQLIDAAYVDIRVRLRK